MSNTLLEVGQMSMNEVRDEIIALILSSGLFEFIELGGPIFQLVLVIGIIMWLLITERVLYLLVFIKQDIKKLKEEWQETSQINRKYLSLVKRKAVSEMHLKVVHPLYSIKALIAVIPLLGLLGTITGMLEVFNIISITGSSSAKVLATGISRATLPTMAGMTTAIAGLYVYSLLHSWARRIVKNVEKRDFNEISEQKEIYS